MGGATLIVDTSRSPRGRLKQVPMQAIRVTGGFWGPKLAQNARRTIPSQVPQLEKSGVIENFKNAAAGTGSFKGLKFNDTDAYKWIEAASLSLVHFPDPGLRQTVDRLVDTISAAQWKDGYLDTYYSFGNENQGWTDLGTMHEMYCAGHLMQAAVANKRATGDTRLLDVALRFADHIDGVFGPQKRPGAPGHPEIEMALVELFRETGARRYLDLALFLLDQRGRVPLEGLPARAIINAMPFRMQTEIVGHAVRSLYLNAGATDIFTETGDQSILETLEVLWESFTQRRMYLTGGAGSRYHYEAFGEDYELPNQLAYAETCANIASLMWNWRMLLLTGEGRFADIMELAVYNSVLSGVSLDGEGYFYMNPLADNGRYRRSEWLRCACCPPNLARTIAALPAYLYGVSEDGIWVNLYAASEAAIPLGPDRVNLAQSTSYPWEGDIDISVSTERREPFEVRLRIPAWAGKARITIDGRASRPEIEKGYARLRGTWTGTRRIRMSLPMEAKYVTSHPHILDNNGRIALQRGPIIYCLEQADNPGCHVWDLALSPESPVSCVHEPDSLGGVSVLECQGSLIDHEVFEGTLYGPARARERKGKRLRVRAVPYFAWANREAGPMIVWARAQRGGGRP